MTSAGVRPLALKLIIMSKLHPNVRYSIIAYGTQWTMLSLVYKNKQKINHR